MGVTVSVGGTVSEWTNQNTEEVKKERFFISTVHNYVQCANFRHTLPLKATNGQTDIKHEKETKTPRKIDKT